MLKVPLSKDKYFLEAHEAPPVDCHHGIYLAGLAHGPSSPRNIAQASGAASRAMTISSAGAEE